MSGFIPTSGGFNPSPRRPGTRSWTRKHCTDSKNATSDDTLSPSSFAADNVTPSVSEDTYITSGNLRPCDSDNFKASGVLFYRSRTNTTSTESIITYEALVGMHAKKNCITLLGGKRMKVERCNETASREFFEETGGLLSATNHGVLNDLLTSSDDSCLKCWLGRSSKSSFSNNCKYVLHFINIDHMVQAGERYVSFKEEIEGLPALFASDAGSELRYGLEKQFREMKSLHFISFDALFSKSGKGGKGKIKKNSSSSSTSIENSATSPEELNFHRFVADGVRGNGTFLALTRAIQTSAYSAVVASYQVSEVTNKDVITKPAEDPSLLIARGLDDLSIG